MNDRIVGIVLSQSDYRDADVLMQVLCKDYGLLSLIGRSAKKITSRNHCLPMCRYEFIIDYKDNKTIYTIHNQKLLNNYFEDKDVVMMSFKNVLAELVLKNREMDLYDDLQFVLEKLSRENMYLLGSLFVSDIIRRFGIAPMVDGCVICGSKKVAALSNRHGGFLCLEHLGGEPVEEVEMLRKFRLINKARFENYEAIKDLTYDFRNFDLLMSFFLDNSDLKLRSYDFYKTLV